MSQEFGFWAVMHTNGTIIAMFQMMYDATAFAKEVTSVEVRMRRVRSTDLVSGKDAVFYLPQLTTNFDASVLPSLPIDTLVRLEQAMDESGYELHLEESAYETEEYNQLQDEIWAHLTAIREEQQRRVAMPSGQTCGHCKRLIAAHERFCSDDCAEAFGSAHSQSFIDGELADRERRAEDRDRYGY